MYESPGNFARKQIHPAAAGIAELGGVSGDGAQFNNKSFANRIRTYVRRDEADRKKKEDAIASTNCTVGAAAAEEEGASAPLI